jgi:site-specific DNA recombinase
VTRTAIYARYSSDLQNPASIENQMRSCRERIARDGGTVVATFVDSAISGASAILRPQFQAMLAAITERQFDCIMAEAIDRYSRNLSDTNDLYELCKFHGVKVMAVDVGEIGLLHVGMQGTMSALFLQNLAAKVKSGQRGAFERGKFPGGLAYGYKIGPKPGTRLIDEAQAKIIRRIFVDYLSGMSPRKISKALNLEGVPAPTGGQWRASLIVGSRKRGNGLFHNALLNGVLVVGRQRKAKNPTTGKTVMQEIPKHEWRMRPEPTMRIVSEADWAAVQTKIDRMGGTELHYRRQAPRLLSGLIKCACCGGPMTGKSAGRLVCRTAHEEGTCDHAAPIHIEHIEGRVVAALQGLLADKEWEQVFAAEYRSHRAKVERQGPEHRAALQARHAKAERAMAGLMKAIEDGLYTPDMKQRLADLTAEREAATRALAALQLEITVIYPRMADRFKIMHDDMGKWLSTEAREAMKAKQIIRSITKEVYVYKPEPTQLRRIEFTGQIQSAIDGGERGS